MTKYLQICAPCCSVHLCVVILTVIVTPIIGMVGKYAIDRPMIEAISETNRVLAEQAVTFRDVTIGLFDDVDGFHRYFNRHGSFELQSLKSSIIQSELAMHQRFGDTLKKGIFVHRAVEQDICGKIDYLWSEGGVFALCLIGDKSIGKTTSTAYVLFHHNVSFKLYVARIKWLAILSDWMMWIMSFGYLSIDQYYYETVPFFDLYQNTLKFIEKYPNKTLKNDLQKDYNNIPHDHKFHVVHVLVDFMKEESVERQISHQLFGHGDYDLTYWLREVAKDLEYNLLIWVESMSMNMRKYNQLISTARKIYIHNSNNVRFLIELSQADMPQHSEEREGRLAMFRFVPLTKEEINQFATSYSGKECNLNESEMRIIGGKPNNLIQFIAAGSMENYLLPKIEEFNTIFDVKKQKMLTDILYPICEYQYIYNTIIYQKYVIDVIDIMAMENLNKSQSRLVETMIDMIFIEYYKNNHWKFTDNSIGYLVCDVVNEY